MFKKKPNTPPNKPNQPNKMKKTTIESEGKVGESERWQEEGSKDQPFEDLSNQVWKFGGNWDSILMLLLNIFGRNVYSSYQEDLYQTL